MKLTSLTLLSFAISTPTSVPPLGLFVAKVQKHKSCHLAEGGHRPRKAVPLQHICNTPWDLMPSVKIFSYLVMAMEVRGVVGAPFHTIVLPQDMARAEFQP